MCIIDIHYVSVAFCLRFMFRHHRTSFRILACIHFFHVISTKINVSNRFIRQLLQNYSLKMSKYWIRSLFEISLIQITCINIGPISFFFHKYTSLFAIYLSWEVDSLCWLALPWVRYFVGAFAWWKMDVRHNTHWRVVELRVRSDIGWSW